MAVFADSTQEAAKLLVEKCTKHPVIDRTVQWTGQKQFRVHFTTAVGDGMTCSDWIDFTEYTIKNHTVVE